MLEPMTSQYAFSFPDQSSFSTQKTTFNSFSPRQTYNTTEPVTTSQPNPQTSTNFQNQQFQQYHTATLSSNNVKFPYLKKDEYETWTMKMEYWIMNTDHNLWKIIQNGNSKKSLGMDSKRGIIILPPVSFEEHIAVQRETKARTLLLQSLPKDHMADFHHLDDAREIWLAVKARFGVNEESKKIRKTMLKQPFSEFIVSEEGGLHKGYDRFQKILSQLNQMQANPDNDDVNIKFLRALPLSWSQVALTLKTRGGLEYLSFDNLYNKLRSLKIDVKGGSSYGSRSTTVALTHSAFIGAAITNSKLVYSDQPIYSSSISYNHASFGSIIEDVFHSFVVENKPTQQLAYEDFKQLGHFARECNVKKVDEKAMYSAFKISETEEAKQVYGLMARFDSNFAVHADNTAGGVHPAAAKFAMMGISPKAKLEKKEWEVKFIESLARFDKWKETSKNLAKLLYSSMSTRTKLGLGFKEYIRSDEVCDLSTPSVFDPEPVNREVKSLSERFVKASNMHEVPSPITRTFMPSSYQSDLAESQATFGSKSNISSIPTSKTNDFVSCDNSDKSSASETYDFASCVSSLKTNDSFSTVDVKLFPKSDINDPSLTNGLPSCSFKENVKPPRNLTSVPAGNRNSSASISAGRSIPAASRNETASIHAGRSIHAASRNKPVFIHAGKHIPADRINKPAAFPTGSSVPTGWTNPAASPFFRPTNLYFDNVYWPGIYDHMSINEGRQSSAVKSSADFQLPDESQVVLRIPRWHDLYTFNLSGIQPEQHINYLLAKASLEESTKCHIRMAHVNFKTINKLAKHGLVKGLPLKLFTNEHNCVAYNKGKQHKASYKAISAVRTISEPLYRFCWAFFMGIKDKTFYILKYFIALIENQLNKKVKAIRCDNRTEFQNAKLITLCREKGIKRDYSNAKPLQQNGVAERKNKILIEAARSMVSITNPHNKTPYELLSGKVPNIRHLKPFGCQVTILNTSDHLGKFKGKANDGFLVGYVAHSKAYRVYNLSSKKVEEMLNLRYLEDKPNVQGLGQEWNLVPAAGDPAGGVPTGSVPANGVPAGSVPASSVLAGEVLAGSIVSTGGVPAGRVLAGSVHASGVPASSVPAGGVLTGSIVSVEFGNPAARASVPDVLTTAPAATSPVLHGHSLGSCEHTTRFHSLSDLGNHQPTAVIFSSSSYDDDFYADVTNLASNVAVDPVATKRVNTIHPKSQIIGALQSLVHTRSTVQKSKFGESAFISYVHNQNRTNHADHLHCLFAYFISQLEPSSVAKALEEPDWVAAMQEEMQQFYNQQV
nr:hypothetical protein [Tanacetum cinerariifolium]